MMASSDAAAANVATSVGLVPKRSDDITRVAASARTIPCEQPECGQPHPLAEDVGDDIARGRAERDADANFTTPLRRR